MFGATGAAGTTTSNNAVLIDFTNAMTTEFNVQLDITNASFSGTATATPYSQSTTDSLEAMTSVTGCTVQVLADKLLINNCNPTASTAPRIDALAISGIVLTAANALSTAGTSVTLSGIVRNSTNTTTYENMTSAAWITSKSAADAAIQTGGAIVVDNTATGPFTLVGLTGANATTAATLGTVHFSATSAVGTDLSVVFGQGDIGSNVEVKVTHGILSQSALTSISLTQATSASLTQGQFVSGTASFTVGSVSLNGAAITVQFNGTTPITSTTGTASATVTPNAEGLLLSAVGAFTGNVAAFTRGGLSIELNTLQPTAELGSTLYQSFVRLTNTSSDAGIATITVKDDVTGTTLGSFTTAALTDAISAGKLGAGGTVPAGATFQFGSADIEANVPTAAASKHPYKVIVSGAFNGYAQHVMWNSVAGSFYDLSGFRNGALTVDP